MNKKCLLCRKQFELNRLGKIYCSHTCSSRARNLMTAKELFRLSPDELKARDRVIKFYAKLRGVTNG